MGNFIESEIRRGNRNLLITAASLGVPAAALLAVGLTTADRGATVAATTWGGILGVISLSFLVVLAIRLPAGWHPLLRGARRYGDPGEVGAAIAGELAEGSVARVKSLTVTPHWLLQRRAFGSRISSLRDVMWAHRLDTTQYVNGIKTGKRIELKVFLRNGTGIKLGAGREAVARQMMEQIQAKAPWTILGYTSDLEAAWKAQRAEFIAIVDRRRAAVESGAADTPARSSGPALPMPDLYPSTKAPLILILGILGLFTPLGVVAWILGHLERREVARGKLAPSTALTAGWALGIAGTVFFAVTMLSALIVAHRVPVVPH